jgi:beta-lactamase class A
MRYLGILCAFAALSGCGVANTAPDKLAKSEQKDASVTVMSPLKKPVEWNAIKSIETKTGGRIGAALINSKTGAIWRYRGDERFVMCSTFKMPLAAAVLAKVDQGALKLSDSIKFTKADILDNSPVSQDGLENGSLNIEQLARGTIQRSDNTAANLLLVPVGGPAGLTAQLRNWGDAVTRVDRNEPSMNENIPGDPRDTTSPLAMATLNRALIEGDALMPASRAQLANWMIGTQTGVARIRAGLPKNWLVGNKTGTCGTAWNDVAFFRPKTAEAYDGSAYYLAVFIDRPTASDAAIEAAIADIARLAVTLVPSE